MAKASILRELVEGKLAEIVDFEQARKICIATVQSSHAGEKSKPEAAMSSLEATPDAHSRPRVLSPDATLSSLIGIIPESTVQSKYIFSTLTSLG